MRRVLVDALDRAHHDALRFVEMADALGAARRIDQVDLLALGNRLVGAGRLADVAVDAKLVDAKGHELRWSRCGESLRHTVTAVFLTSPRRRCTCRPRPRPPAARARCRPACR